MRVETTTSSAGVILADTIDLSELMSEIENVVNSALRGDIVSISHLRAEVQAVARLHPRHVIWAGDVRHGYLYVVTIWPNFAICGKEGETAVVVLIPDGTRVL